MKVYSWLSVIQVSQSTQEWADCKPGCASSKAKGQGLGAPQPTLQSCNPQCSHKKERN